MSATTTEDDTIVRRIATRKDDIGYLAEVVLKIIRHLDKKEASIKRFK